MPSNGFRIRKISDRELSESIKHVEKHTKVVNITVLSRMISYTQETKGGKNWLSKTLQDLIELNCMWIDAVTINFESNAYLTFSRDHGNLLTDAMSLNTPDNLNASAINSVFQVAKAVQEAFGKSTASAFSVDILGAEFKAHFDAREQYLVRQEREVSDFFIKMADFNRSLTEQHLAKMAELEADFANRQKDLNEQHRQRMTELDLRDAEFDKRKAEFDLQESRGARRKLREDQKKQLTDLTSKFTLTAETEGKRRPVWIAAVCTILTLAGITLYLMFGMDAKDSQGHFDYPLIVRQTTFAVTTIGFIWFFIVWSNRWFQRHADEELRLKRLLLDLDRASWVFEMILDWQKETKQEFPPELLKQLAKNLYTVDGVGEDDMTKADLLAALLGSAANMKLKGPGGEVEFDRKSLKKAEEKNQLMSPACFTLHQCTDHSHTAPVTSINR